MSNMIYASGTLQLKLFRLRKAVWFKTGESWKDFCEVIGMSPTVAKKIYDADEPSKVAIYKSSREQVEAAYKRWFNE